MTMKTQAKPSLWRGAVAGASGGAVGSLCMSGFQHVANSFMHRQGSNGEPESREAGDEASQEQSVPATVKSAEAIAHRTLGRSLTDQEKRVAGPFMHYSFGTVTGAAYGIAAEFAPKVRAGAGLPFGAAVWLAADEIAVPALGFAEPAWRYPASTHIYALASHLVYGLSAEMSRRVFRRILAAAQ